MSVETTQRRPVHVLRAPDRSLVIYLWHCLIQFRLVRIIGAKLLREFYQTTILGWWWLIIRALTPTLGMIMIFQFVGAFQSSDLPYALFVASGMVVFTPIDIGLMKGVRSMAGMIRVLKELPVPRLLVPLGSLALPLVYHLVFLAFLGVVLVFFLISHGSAYIEVSWHLLLFPVLVLMVMMLIGAIAGIASVIFLFAKDVRFIMPLLRQVWFFATPVIYPIDTLPPTLAHYLMILNPMAPIVETARWALFGIGEFQTGYFFCSLAGISVLFLLCAWFMMRSDWVLDEVI